MALNLYTVPPETPFLDAVARGWLARAGGDGADPLAIGRGLILLPTRRAARSLAEAFLRANAGHPLLLPRITALGALDEAPLALSGALDLPPAIEPMQRLAALTRLILKLDGRNGAPRTADRAWPLARELASLMDEAERAGIDLAERLPDAADPAFAHHWAETLTFLHIVTDAWPNWLTENAVMNPAARQVALLEAQAQAWAEHKPEDPVLIAGATAGIPAVGRLLKVVARTTEWAGGAATARPDDERRGVGEAGAVARPGRAEAFAGRAWCGQGGCEGMGNDPAAVRRHAVIPLAFPVIPPVVLTASPAIPVMARLDRAISLP